MKPEEKKKFITLWQRFFAAAELPIVFYYTDAEEVEPDILTLAVPFNKFAKMVRNMEESFLITKSWDKVKQRLPAE